MEPKKVCIFSLVLILMMVVNTSRCASGWQKPGCYRVGHTRRIEIPGCVQFDMTTNACRGFCVSYSVPSGIETMLLNPKQTTTSVGQCCNIVQSEDVKARVMCLDGPRDLVFKSAKKCACFHCKKE